MGHDSIVPGTLERAPQPGTLETCSTAAARQSCDDYSIHSLYREHRHVGFHESSSVFGSAVVGGVAAGIAARSWAAEDAPGRKIVVGVMGMGGRGTELARQFSRQPGVRSGLCLLRRQERGWKPRPGRSEKVCEQDPKQVGDFRRILDDQGGRRPGLRRADHWHAPATILACTAGKHVYVEKPCCHNPREGELQVAAAPKNTTASSRWARSAAACPGIIEGIAELRDGAIGKVRLARGWYTNRRPTIGRGQAGRVPEWLDYELWQGPAPRRPYRSNVVHYNWHWFWHWGNGEIGNNGVHAIDVCRWGLGVDFPTPRHFVGRRHYCYDDDQETPDTHVVSYEFGDADARLGRAELAPARLRGEHASASPSTATKGTLVIDGGRL